MAKPKKPAPRPGASQSFTSKAPAKPKPEINEQQQLFVLELCGDPSLNRTAAAKRAGYSEATARQIGYQLMQIPAIREAVKSRLKEIHDDLLDSAGRVRAELVDRAYADLADFSEVKSPADLKKLPPDLRRAVVGWSWSQSGDFVLEFDKKGALQLLGKVHKLFTDKLEVTDKSGLAEKLARARARAAGRKK